MSSTPSQGQNNDPESSPENLQLKKPPNLRWSNSWEDFSKYASQPFHEHPSFDGSSCVGNAFRNFLNCFIIAYGIRTTISVVIRAVQLLRTRPSLVFSISHLFSEKNLTAREDAVRLGLSFGVFSGLFNLSYCFLRKWRKKEDGWNSFISGCLAGLSILFQEKENRRTPALYILARLCQCLYNAAKKRGWWHFWGSNWNYGDSLLFIISSAQVMYAYVMRPETLPESYYKFIVRTGPIHEVILQAVRDNCRDKPVVLKHVVQYFDKFRPTSPFPLKDAYPPIIPCSLLHPRFDSCWRADLDVYIQTAKKILPLYTSLTIVPVLAFQLGKLTRQPIKVLSHTFFGLLQSIAFLSCFVGLYQTLVCLQRKIVVQDHKFSYFLAGAVAALSILIEKKSRRSELALYVMPRALDSVYMLLCDRKWLSGIPNGDVLIFCLSMGGLMYFFHNESEAMSPLLEWVIKILFRKRML